MKSMKSMKMDDIIQKLYVGLDIHEDYITGTAMREDGAVEFSGNFKNTKEAAQCFLSGVPSPQVKIAIEACGLWRGVYNMLTDLGYDVVLADTYKTHQIVGTKDIDKVNSETLADLLRIKYLPQVYVPTEDVLFLRDAARHRKRMVDQRTQLKCMTRSYLMRDGIKCPEGWSKESMDFFRKAHPYTAHFINIIETIDEQIKQMDKLIKNIAYNTYLSNLLQKTPGIGPFSSVMTLGEIGDIKRFLHPKKLIKYAGLCPGIYQSGSKSYPVRDKACNKYLKWIMYECSGRAIRMDTKYQKHYWRVCRRKDKQVARRSAARKMLTDVWFMLTYEKEFTPSYE